MTTLISRTFPRHVVLDWIASHRHGTASLVDAVTAFGIIAVMTEVIHGTARVDAHPSGSRVRITQLGGDYLYDALASAEQCHMRDTGWTSAVVRVDGMKTWEVCPECDRVHLATPRRLDPRLMKN